MLLRSGRAQDRQVRGLRPNEREDLLGDAVHLLALGTALKEEQVDADALELAYALGDLIGRADETRAQASVGDAVVLERHLGLELRAFDEIQVARVPAGARAHIRDARHLFLHVGVTLTDDGVSGDPEAKRRELGVLRPPRAPVGGLWGWHAGRGAAHE